LKNSVRFTLTNVRCTAPSSKLSTPSTLKSSPSGGNIIFFSWLLSGMRIPAFSTLVLPGAGEKNLIHCLRHEGQDYTAHGAKALILHNFYTELLGRSETPVWRFALSDLYPHLDVIRFGTVDPFFHG
jgi:hypothetical protein